MESTSTLAQGIGGIWEINLIDSSHLDFSGGEMGNLDIFNNATATLSGGLIISIESNQIAWESIGGEPPQVIPNPHITIVYSGDLPTYNETTNILSGLWGGGDPFSIYLSDAPVGYGYSPAIDNIQFELIPEPATLLLFSLGGLLLRRK